jgi:hypothetical protein
MTSRLNSAKAGANNDDPWSFIYDKRRETTNMLMGLNLACFLLQVATRGRLMNWGAKVTNFTVQFVKLEHVCVSKRVSLANPDIRAAARKYSFVLLAYVVTLIWSDVDSKQNQEIM